MSRIISFDWTTPALLAGRKTCTRRDWSVSYASRFKQDEVCQAWDHLPRTRKGRKVGDIRLTVTPYLESLAEMPDEDFEAEGFAFFEEYPHLLPAKAGPMALSFEWWRHWHGSISMVVVRFKLEDIVKDVLQELEAAGRPVASFPLATPQPERSC